MVHNRIAVIIVLSLCLMFSACSPAASPAATPTAPPLAAPTLLSSPPASGAQFADLVEQGTLSFRVVSGSINQLGLNLKNSGSQPVQVDIPAGTFFVNDDPQSQNMVVLHPAGLALQPGERADVLLDVACANLRRSEPTGSDTFTVQRAPESPVLSVLIDRLSGAGVDFPVEQAAVWIITDDASYDELGMLVKDTRFGDPVITENDAARALMLIDQAGLNVHQRLIWEDLIQLWAKADDPDVSDWMDTQYATQAVLNATQDVIKRTQAAVTSTHMALEETQFVLTETAYQASFAQTLTAEAPVETPLPTVSFATAQPGEISQFAIGASASSEYSASSWSAMQAAGAPNTAQCGDNNTAWASSASSGTDWLRLTYAASGHSNADRHLRVFQPRCGDSRRSPGSTGEFDDRVSRLSGQRRRLPGPIGNRGQRRQRPGQNGAGDDQAHRLERNRRRAAHRRRMRVLTENGGNHDAACWIIPIAKRFHYEAPVYCRRAAWRSTGRPGCRAGLSQPGAAGRTRAAGCPG